MIAIEDEQTVNTALVSFLIAVTIHSTEIKGEWSLSRQAFYVVIETKSSKKKICEARVDGVLRTRKDLEVKAIVEVKPFLRYTSRSEFIAIKMQEAGQMAAWISSQPPRNLDELREKKMDTTRLLISQDRHEIYLTFASFGAAYIDYIRGAPDFDTVSAFLTMYEVGPFSTEKPEHMESLAVLVLAFSLQECA